MICEKTFTYFIGGDFSFIPRLRSIIRFIVDANHFHTYHYFILLIGRKIMFRILSVFFAFVLSTASAIAGNIIYGYNAQGDYVPIEIDGQKVEYGYNAQGDYVPTAIGKNRVEYGYNAQGDYLPTAIGKKRVEYGYNPQGDYVPTSVGKKKIEYGYNPQGDYVPTSIGNSSPVLPTLPNYDRAW